jgi:hypothetical protein
MPFIVIIAFIGACVALVIAMLSKGDKLAALITGFIGALLAIWLGIGAHNIKYVKTYANTIHEIEDDNGHTIQVFTFNNEVYKVYDIAQCVIDPIHESIEATEINETPVCGIWFWSPKPTFKVIKYTTSIPTTESQNN